MVTGMQDAIASQPAELERLLSVPLPERVDALAECRRVHLVGTGTSAHAAELGAEMFALAGIDARWASSARFADWPAPLRPGDGMVLLSHTGETAVVRRVRRQALDAGVPLLTITGEGADWPEAFRTVPRERAETYTVSYTAALLVLARIAGRWGADACAAGHLAAVPAAVRTALDGEQGIEPGRVTVLCGAGPASVTAREGALKLREAARVLAEGYDAETLLHGAAVPLGAEDTLILVQPDALTAALGAAAGAAGVTVAIVEDGTDLSALLAQIPLTVRLQRLALQAATRRGRNPDVVIEGPWADDRLWSLGGPEHQGLSQHSRGLAHPPGLGEALTEGVTVEVSGGITSTWPSVMRLGSLISLAAASAAVVVPKRWAMTDSVSPACTS